MTFQLAIFDTRAISVTYLQALEAMTPPIRSEDCRDGLSPENIGKNRDTTLIPGREV